MFIYLMNFRRSVYVAVSVIDSRLLARAGLISGNVNISTRFVTASPRTVNTPRVLYSVIGLSF
jgi:hypothetical protein